MSDKKYALLLPELNDMKELKDTEETLGDRVWNELKERTAEFDLIKTHITEFGDDSFKIEIGDSVRNKQVYIFISPYMNASKQVMLTVQMIEACRRANADRNGINLIETYNPWYAQDKRDVDHRESNSGRAVAQFYITSGLTHLFYFEPHSLPALEGWYDSVDPIFMSSFHASHLAEEFELTNTVVGMPDEGSKRSEYLAEALGVPVVKIGKSRDHRKVEEAKAMPVTQDLSGKTVLLYDDMIRTGTTIITTSESAKNAGADRIIPVATHLSIYNPKKLFGCGYIDAIRGTSTIPKHPTHEKLKVYDISDFAAEIIHRKTHNMSVREFITKLAPSYKE